MLKRVTLGLFGTGLACSLLALVPVSITPARPVAGLLSTKSKSPLPDDLPQAKLLFVKYSLVELPAGGPTGWGRERAKYFTMKNHNKVTPEANTQLVETARRYPYAYRVTTLDSVPYYHEKQGYKYVLMHDGFGAGSAGQYTGMTSNHTSNGTTYTSTSIDLYVEDLNNGTRYVFNDFSGTFIYYNKGIVEMLLKKVSKQFEAKK